MQIERQGTVALLRMNAGKANAINDAWIARMDGLLDALAAAPPGALVITGDARVFCAGLDLPSLILLEAAALERFIGRFSDIMLRIFALPFPVVAAVNGHAVAGGCVLALQADRRLMAAGDGRIGLNEIQLGIGLPAVVVETLRCQVPPASAFAVTVEGRLHTAEDALRLGLVDEVVEPGRLLETALERAATLASLPGPAFSQVKASLRAPALAAIRAAGPRDAAGWVATFHAPQAQQRLREVVARLSKKTG